MRSFLFAGCLLALLGGCKKEDDTPEPVSPGGPPVLGSGNGFVVTAGEQTLGYSTIAFWTRLGTVDDFQFLLDVHEGGQELFNEVHTGAAPAACWQGGPLFTVQPGTHQFTVYSPALDISWHGEVTVAQDQCKLVEITEPAGIWGRGKLVVYAQEIWGTHIAITISDVPGVFHLTEAYSSAPSSSSAGVFTGYLPPGDYTVYIHNGTGSDGVGDLIDVNDVTLSAGQQQIMAVTE